MMYREVLKRLWVQGAAGVVLVSFSFQFFPAYAMLPHQRGHGFQDEDVDLPHLKNPFTEVRIRSQDRGEVLFEEGGPSLLGPQQNNSFLYAHLPDDFRAPLPPSHQALATHILRLTQAELDPIKTSLYQLSRLLDPALERLKTRNMKDPGGLIGQFNTLKSLFKDPEALVLKTKIDIQNFPQDSTHIAFKKLTSICNEITTYQESLFQSLLPKKIIEESMALLETLKKHYNEYPQELIQALQKESTFEAPKNRLTISHPSALLWGELFEPGHFYRIPQSIAHRLLDFDEHGTREEKPNEAGNHRVTWLGEEQKVFFKNQGFPSLEPTKEAQVWHLYDVLGIPMPSTGILCLDGIRVSGEGAKELFTHGHNKEPFVVQASWGVNGESGDALIKGKESLDFDRETKTLELNEQAYGLQVLGALLSVPGDGKADNFMYDPECKHLISIDNDDVFGPMVDEKRGILKLKSLLLTLPQMDQGIHPSLYKLLRDYTPEVLIGDWVLCLHEHQHRYQTLMDQSLFILKGLEPKAHKVHFLSSWMQGNNLGLPLTLSSSPFIDVYKRWHVLAALCAQNYGLRYHDLLEALDPRVGGAYKRLRQDLKYPYEILLVLYGKNPSKDYTCLETYFSEQEQEQLKEAQESLFLSCGSVFPEESYFPEVLSPEELLEQWCKRQEGWNDSVVRLTLLQGDKGHRRVGLLRPQDPLQDVRSAAVLGIKSQQLYPRLWAVLRSHHPEFHWRMTLEEHFDHPSEEKYQPISGSCKGYFINQDFRILLEANKTHLFESNESVAQHFKKRNMYGRGQVCGYPAKDPTLYFKAYPELPGYEYASTLFMRKMGIQFLPYNELLAFYDPLIKVHYPVLVSQAIAGQPLCDIWKDDTIFKNLDPEHTGLQVLASLLINPEDGKEDNFILSPNKKYLIPIDNDHAFMPGALRKANQSLFKGWVVQEKLQTKSLLFALEMMKETLPEGVRQAFLSLKPDIFLEEWLKELVKVNDRYQSLFTSREIVEASTKGSIIRLPISPSYMEQVYWKFHTLRERIKQDPSLTYLDLLTLVEPYVGKQYKRAFEDKDKKTVRDRFMGVTEGLYQSSRTTAINSREMMEILNISTQDLVGEVVKVKLGPDTALHQLKGLIQARDSLQKRRSALMQGEEDALTQGYNGQGKSLREQQLYLQKLSQNISLMEELTLSHVNALSSSSLELLKVHQGHRLKSLKILDLRGCEGLGDSALQLIAEMCVHLRYLNVSGWQELYVIASSQEYQWKGVFNDYLSSLVRPQRVMFPYLQRLVMNELPKLQRVSLKAPQLLRLESINLPKLQEVALDTPLLTYYGLKGEGSSIHFYSYMADLKGLSTYLQEIYMNNQEIKSLMFSGKDLKMIDIAIIASLFSNLRNLDLRTNEINDKGARTIAGNSILSNLIDLNLGNNNIGAKGARVIAESPTLSGLTSLNLMWNIIGAEGARAIAESPTLSGLTSLNLYNNNIGAEGTGAVAKSPTLSGLTSLNLYNNNIGAEGTGAIAESSTLSGLTSLDLGNNNIGAKGARAIAESPTLSGLTSLNLMWNIIGAESARAIAGSPTLSGLTSLNLRINKIGAVGARAIAESQTLKNLISLNLGLNNIGDEGASAIAESQTLKNLISLKLGDNNISDEGKKGLQESSHLKNTKINF